jgi:hypothetical protein
MFPSDAAEIEDLSGEMYSVLVYMWKVYELGGDPAKARASVYGW